MEVGQIIEVRYVAKQDITFFVDNVPVLKSKHIKLIDKDFNVCLAVFNNKSDSTLKLLGIKTTSSAAYRNKIIPTTPLLLNTVGEVLQRCSSFPEI